MRRRWLFVAALPVVLAACSGSGGSDAALGLGPSPTVTADATTLASAPPSALSPTPSASRSATPTATRTATPAATHRTSSTHPSTTQPTATHTSKPSPKPSATKKPPSTLTIYTNDFYFSPANPTVPRGTKVTVYNPTMDSHTWTRTPAGGFNSGTLTYGESYTYTFNTAGTYNFICKYHGTTYGMKGRITVT
jgi:plastocyanin